ncbi:DUF4349 domain-containing protein [Paenibacillus sp. L3-i20]|uniref:DUF4349 domain-containing protein n=1 Tax=Paenibacillus sp. L3-i20 TaxID=2905833 RepID=UPI001EDCCCC0|nr:DUF4349 domain-containing protein [Paenibacillus sp. L3-i20]GKU78356.1 hypothetical protein L3i20_v227530 [Paenibacillus sp. L3-i20]
MNKPEVSAILPYRKKGKGIMLSVVCLLITVILTGCSLSGDQASEGKVELLSSISNAPIEERSIETEYTAMDSSQSVSAEETASAPITGVSGGAADAIASNLGLAQGKIIYSANIVMEVKELKEASKKIRDAIHLSGGYILEFNDNRNEGEIGARYSIKVPAQGFMSFVDAISQIQNKHFEQSLAGRDVTEEYVDLEARLNAKKLVEERLVVMMEKATKVDDLLKFSTQLGAIQEEIEGIKGKIRYLDNNVAYSTVELRVVQTDQTLQSVKEVKEKSFGGKLSDTLSGSTKAVLAAIKLFIVVLVAALPVLAVAAIVFIPIKLLIKRRKLRPESARNKVPEQRIEPLENDD